MALCLGTCAALIVSIAGEPTTTPAAPPAPLPPETAAPHRLPPPANATAPAANTARTPIPIPRTFGQPAIRMSRPTPMPPPPTSDPTLIPGLDPLPVVGPPVPLAPNLPAGYTPMPYRVPVEEKAFAYDALVKEAALKPGEVTANFTFSLTNTSTSEVTINAVRTSCGCTVVKLPSIPWTLKPGASGSFEVAADVRGTRGIFTKIVTVDSSAGYRHLTVRVSVPEPVSGSMTLARRVQNLQAAFADRQAVFKGDCAACHFQPAIGKRGQQLYDTACGVCHESEQRASIVPNLRVLNKPTDAGYWRAWIANGMPGTVMPAWAITENGPLDNQRIESLVEYLDGPFKTQTIPATASPAPHSSPPTGPTLPATLQPQPPLTPPEASTSRTHPVLNLQSTAL